MSLQTIDKSLTQGPYGNGSGLSIDFEQYICGMEHLLHRKYKQNFAELKAYNSVAGQIAVAGTCVMAASELSSGQTQAVKDLCNETRNSLDSGEILEMSIDGTYPVKLLNMKSSDTLSSLIIRRCESNLRKSGADVPITPRMVDEEIKSRFQRSIRVLSQTVPHLCSDVIPMIQGILPISSGVDSGFVSPTPLLVYIDTNYFKNEIELADALLHEALHHKLLTIRLTKRLHRPGYDDFQSMSVPIPWGGNGYRTFSVGRALAAAHVYAHITLLQASVLENFNDDLNDISNISDIESALITRYKRADYLIQTLLTRHYRHEFGSDGIEFVEWIRHHLNEIENSDVCRDVLVKYQDATVI